MNGVVPLGMTAWLNMPRVVRLLLEESADAGEDVTATEDLFSKLHELANGVAAVADEFMELKAMRAVASVRLSWRPRARRRWARLPAWKRRSLSMSRGAIMVGRW